MSEGPATTTSPSTPRGAESGGGQPDRASAPRADFPGGSRIRSRSRLPRIAQALARAMDLQVRILLVRLQIGLRQFVAYVALLIAAALFGIAGLVFLDFAAFRFVSRHFGTTTSFLIFGVVHLGAAIVLVLAARAQGSAESSPSSSLLPGPASRPSDSEGRR